MRFVCRTYVRVLEKNQERGYFYLEVRYETQIFIFCIFGSYPYRIALHNCCLQVGGKGIGCIFNGYGYFDSN